MALATPNSSNDAALNAQLDITRDASIANLEQKSSEVQQQYCRGNGQIEIRNSDPPKWYKALLMPHGRTKR